MKIFGFFMLLAALASPAMAQTTAITGGRVVIGDGSAPIEGGTVLLRGDKVVAAGASVSIPADARRIDATGKWVTPGLIAGFSRVGLVEVSGVSSTNDSRAGSSVDSAALDVAPALNPASSAIAVSRSAGVTRAIVAPDAGKTIFGGQGAIVDLGADRDMVTQARAFQFVELGESGAGRAGGSRAAAFALLQTALRSANRTTATTTGDISGDNVLTQRDLAALRAVVAGGQPLLVHVERASDISTVLGLHAEFPKLRLILVGATEGWLVADEIAKAGVPVIASALKDLPEAFEQLAATQSNIGRMRAAGVRVGIGMIDDDDAHQLRYTPQYAGNLVALQRVSGATGLNWDAAFASISGDVARLVAMDQEIGSLRPGRQADVVIWSGDPLELSSHVEQVWIDGVEQSLDNRQQRLRDRYRTPAPGSLPKAYDR